jgi:hypothetical protein
MSSNWTRRALSAAALAPALLLLACGGNDTNSNRIKPLQATLNIAAFPNSPDPAVYFVKDPKDTRFPDLETVQVRLYTTTPQTFDDYSIEIHFDPSVIQVGTVFEYDPSVLGGCFSGNACAPIACLVNQDVNSTGTLIISVAGSTTAPCSATTLTTDTMLVRIGFIVQNTIDPPGSPIEFIVGPGTGHCEILLGLTNLGIPFEDGNALMTATH